MMASVGAWNVNGSLCQGRVIYVLNTSTFNLSNCIKD